MGERLLCKQEVIGSIPFTSTISPRADEGSGIRCTIVEATVCRMALVMRRVL